VNSNERQRVDLGGIATGVKRPSKQMTKRAIQRRFHRALVELQAGTGWSAKELAAKSHLPHRTVLNWLTGRTCPGPNRLKTLCGILGWDYGKMFQGEALNDELFESEYLDLEKSSRHYLSLRPRDPLEAWGHVPLAGALVYVDLAAAGFECRGIIDYSFGTRIEFHLPALKQVSLQVGVIFDRGLTISWLDEMGLVREQLDLTDSNLKIIKQRLRVAAGS